MREQQPQPRAETGGSAGRRWTEASDRDPGVALLELLGFLGDSLSAYAERLADEGYVGSARRGLLVEVDGVEWQRVPDFEKSDADDPHYVVNRSEDGATVIDFGDGEHGRRPPPDSRLSVRYRRGLRYASVHLQQGRVILNEDWRGATRQTVHGVWRGTVVDSADPLGQSRLQLTMPGLGAGSSVWARPVLPPDDPAHLPATGEIVWVLFEEGDAAHPLWLARAPA